MHADSRQVLIVGGGLAGIALSIQLARLGHTVTVFEKEQYPFHRVCGEYISMESWDFLQSLGLDLSSLNVSRITHLQVSGINGKLLEHPLPLGGFGISRYRLDYELFRLAKQAGVIIYENTKVNEVFFDGKGFSVEASGQSYKAAVVCGSYGKRSNLDVLWKRPFITAIKNRLNNYVGVKYHVRGNYPPHVIALHNFKNGYCGLAKIEDDKYCVCYLTRASNLKASKGVLPEMEKTVLSQNPYLEKIFSDSEILFDEPVTISQISFDKKSQVEDHVLMIGDAAGMIAPLCGNGMSMALHGSKLAAHKIDFFLQGKISREEMESAYTRQWQQQFSSRLRMGRRIQRMFGSKWLTDSLITLGRIFPGMIRFLIKKTHGKPF
jgi:menaquinone-9 beta-reductase